MNVVSLRFSPRVLRHGSAVDIYPPQDAPQFFNLLPGNGGFFSA
jgi:hypothetical protein